MTRRAGRGGGISVGIAVGFVCAAAGSPAALAATSAVQWGGDYVSATVPYAGHVPANASGSDIYGDPDGPFVIDVDADGADDSVAGRALSLTAPFNPTSGYGPGTSLTFYGGAPSRAPIR